jgi:hypothetical protein
MFKPGWFRSLALGATLLAAVAPASAGAAPQMVNGNASLTVRVPDVIILDYFTSINLAQCAIAEDHGQSFLPLSNIIGDEPSPDGNTARTSGNPTDGRPVAFNYPDVAVTMKNVWAVRGFSTRGNATVSAIGPASSAIGVSNRQLMTEGTHEPVLGNSISTGLNGIRKENATMGDILMSLNFANNPGFFTIMVVTM